MKEQKLSISAESNRFIYKVIRFKEIGKDRNSKSPYYTGNKLNYIDYITRSEADLINESPKLYDLSGNELDKEDIKAEIKNLKDKQLIWDQVLSFKPDSETKIDFNNAKAISNLIKAPFENYLKLNGFKTKNIRVFYSIHNNTNNPHIHLGFYEVAPGFITNNPKKLGFKQKGELFGKDCIRRNILINQLEKSYIIQNDFLTDTVNLKNEFNKTLETEIQNLKNNNNFEEIKNSLRFSNEKTPSKKLLNKNASLKTAVNDLTNEILLNAPVLQYESRKYQNSLKEINSKLEKLDQIIDSNKFSKFESDVLSKSTNKIRILQADIKNDANNFKEHLNLEFLKICRQIARTENPQALKKYNKRKIYKFYQWKPNQYKQNNFFIKFFWNLQKMLSTQNNKNGIWIQKITIPKIPKPHIKTLQKKNERSL